MAKKPEAQKSGRSKGPIDLGGATEKVPFKKIPLRLKDKYRSEVVTAMKEKFNYKNVMQVPRLEKVVVNLTTKEAIQNVKLLETAVDELTAITGQKAVMTKSRKSIANFKLREGVPIGARVTLRGTRMWEFVDRLITVAIPRIRDFRGVSPKAFDGRGNYSLGLTEQIIFPEIDYDKVNRISGMNITFVTSARTDEEARALLRSLGMPFAS
jgi:large subunit ribosomal protein L5